MEFIEAPAFTRHVYEYLSEDGYGKLQNHLALAPESGDMIPAAGGFRKIRWADARRGKGRRGGLRVIYYYFANDQQIWLMTLYDKDEAADLTPKEKHALKEAIEMEVEARRQSAPRRHKRRRR